MYLENNEVKRYPIRSILAWSAVVLWMAVIFAFSHQTSEASSQLSMGLTERIIGLFFPGADAAFLAQSEAVLRSVAHGITFFILALLVSWAFTEIQVQDIRNAILTFLVCALYAASDELHQAFVPGRAGQWIDFLIDMIGVLVAITLYQIISTLRFLRKDLQVKREEDLRI
jgi:VanZ family protein